MVPIITLCALFMIAAALIIAGIGLLAGLAWALIAAGLMLFCAAAALRSGVIADG